MPLYEITTDKSRMSVEAAHAFLSQSYWSQDVPLSIVRTAFENSLCFAALAEGEQVGFARVVTDRATFAYLFHLLGSNPPPQLSTVPSPRSDARCDRVVSWNLLS